ncbi:MAG: alpha/beta fold hydrolase, partial [Rubrivivax sp.]|nr:alpha/beta fold hydrolase [Rubrivivax sp.]
MTRLVFLPGLANDGEVFDEVREHLRRRVPAALRPLVDAARVSDVATRRATLPEMARALLDEDGDAAAGPLLLVGHSMGGMLAQHVV